MYARRFGVMTGFLLLAVIWFYLMQMPHVVK